MQPMSSFSPPRPPGLPSSHRSPPNSYPFRHRQPFPKITSTPRLSKSSSSPRANLTSLPPELLLAIATLLPLSSLSSFIAASPRRFSTLHGLTIRSPAFCPWRRRWAGFQRVLEAAEREAEGASINNGGRNGHGGGGAGGGGGEGGGAGGGGVPISTAATEAGSSEGGGGVVKGPCQLEYEAVVAGYQADFGFAADAQKGGRFLKLDETMLVFSIWRMFSPRAEDGVRNVTSALRLRGFGCGFEALMKAVERRCGCPFERLEKLMPPGLGDGRIGNVGRCYLLLVAYLIYGGLVVEDVSGVLMDALRREEREDKRGEVEAELCEFFCFLGLYVEMWEGQVGMLAKERVGEVDGLSEGSEYWWAAGWRRIVGFGVRKWVEERFADARPVMLEKDDVGTGRSGLQRSVSWGIDASFERRMNLISMDEKNDKRNSGVLTDEQKMIVGTELSPGDLMKIRAFAGTGKTRSLVEYAKARPRKRFLYVAFNKSAAQDAGDKFGSNVGCECLHHQAMMEMSTDRGGGKTGRTMHSTALKVLKHVAPTVYNAKDEGIMSISDWGTKQIIDQYELNDTKHIFEALENPARHLPPGRRHREGDDPTLLLFPTATSVATAVKIILDRFWASTAPKINKFHIPLKMIERLGLKADVILRWAKLIWHNLTLGQTSFLPHDAYLKLMSLSPLGDTAAFSYYDTIMFDEAQDANPCMASIILRQSTSHSIIIVGDPYQKIYGFRGAGNDCFNDELYPPTHTRLLTHSFRFGPGIASLANTLLRTALKSPSSVSGVRAVDSVSFPSAVTSSLPPEIAPTPQSAPYTIIFRRNQTLVSHAISFSLSHPDHKLYLRLTRAFSHHTLFSSLRAAHALYTSNTRATFGPLSEWKTWQALREFVNAANESGDESPAPILSLVVGLEEHLSSPDFLLGLAGLERNVLTDDQVRNGRRKPDVTFITTHQAKGLEWDRVEVIGGGDFGVGYGARRTLRLPGKGGEYAREEANMLYVAMTRAKQELIVGRDPVGDWITAERGCVTVRAAEGWGRCRKCRTVKGRHAVAAVRKVKTLSLGRFDQEETIEDVEMEMGMDEFTTGPLFPHAFSASPASGDTSPPSTPPTGPPARLEADDILFCRHCSKVVEHFLFSLAAAEIGWRRWEAAGYMGKEEEGVVEATQQAEVRVVERWRRMESWAVMWKARERVETERVKGWAEEGEWWGIRDVEEG